MAGPVVSLPFLLSLDAGCALQTARPGNVSWASEVSELPQRGPCRSGRAVRMASSSSAKIREMTKPSEGLSSRRRDCSWLAGRKLWMSLLGTPTSTGLSSTSPVPANVLAVQHLPRESSFHPSRAHSAPLPEALGHQLFSVGLSPLHLNMLLFLSSMEKSLHSFSCPGSPFSNSPHAHTHRPLTPLLGSLLEPGGGAHSTSPCPRDTFNWLVPAASHPSDFICERPSFPSP